MTATPSRLAALRVLRAVRSGGLADAALHAELPALPPRERAWTTELVQGALRLRGRLDHILAQFTRRSLDRLDGDVLDTLRLGAYQLLQMDSVPAYAAVSQSVDLARPTGAATLVNAVLRAVRRGAADVPFPDFDEDPVGWLATWGSHPRWMVERWVQRFGADAARRLVDLNNERPALYLRLVRGTTESAVQALEEADIDVRSVDGEPRVLRLGTGADVGRALEIVPAVVQDPAAGRVAAFVGPLSGDLIDLCAAPGGKAAVLAARNGTGHASRVRVTAADASWARIGRVVDNIRRLGLPVGVVVADGREPPFRPVDAVLVDAPCTGTGTLRRHADLRWRVGPGDLETLGRLQAELLAGAARTVRPGGLLVYATCSLEDEENDVQVEAFLERHPEFDTEPPAFVEGVAASDGITGGTLRLLPHIRGFDGAFAVRMRRRR